MKANTNDLKDTLASVNDFVSPIVEEIEGEEEMRQLKEENDYMDQTLGNSKRSDEAHKKAEQDKAKAKTEGEVYEAKYREKITARCDEQLSRGTARCR